MNKENSEGHLDSSHPFVGKYVNALQSITSERNMALDEKSQKSAISLAVMVKNPDQLPRLAQHWQTSYSQITRFIATAYEDPTLTEIGNELFDKTHIKKVDKITIEKKINRVIDEYGGDFVSNHKNSNKTRIFELKMKGATNIEIAQELGLSEWTVRTNLVDIRSEIEGKFAEAGIKQVTKFGGKKMSTAARSGSLHASLFWGQYYTSRMSVEQYERYHRKTVDESLIRSGYVLLFLNTTPNEYSAFKVGKSYAPFLVRRHGLIYIKPEDLQQCRNVYTPNTNPDIPQSDEPYLPLNHFVSDRVSREVMRNALEDGRIKGVLTRVGWYVTSDEANRFLEDYNKIPDNHKAIKDFSDDAEQMKRIRSAIQRKALTTMRIGREYYISLDQLSTIPQNPKFPDGYISLSKAAPDKPTYLRMLRDVRKNKLKGTQINSIWVATQQDIDEYFNNQ